MRLMVLSSCFAKLMSKPPLTALLFALGLRDSRFSPPGFSDGCPLPLVFITVSMTSHFFLSGLFILYGSSVSFFWRHELS